MILDSGFLRIDTLPSGTDLVAELRAVQAEGSEVPCLWSLASGPTDDLRHPAPTLDVGFDPGTGRGALVWSEPGVVKVPVDGLNAEWKTYHLGGTHDTRLPAGAEVGLETMYAALAEFLNTRTQPATVRWVESPMFEDTRPGPG
ncbi:Imm1 family immunity protein [Actinokineospora sp. 24-640]